jgi:hypothetical protein
MSRHYRLFFILQGHPVFILVLNLIGTIFIEYTWDACYLCSAEGFPTEVRAIGVGTCSLIARIGALMAPQVIHVFFRVKKLGKGLT